MTKKFLVLWWMEKAPHAALFESEFAAEVVAKVRNALVVTISTKGLVNVDVEDWFRRNDEGRPMPAEWCDLLGYHHHAQHLEGGAIG